MTCIAVIDASFKDLKRVILKRLFLYGTLQKFMMMFFCIAFSMFRPCSANSQSVFISCAPTNVIKARQRVENNKTWRCFNDSSSCDQSFEIIVSEINKKTRGIISFQDVQISGSYQVSNCWLMAMYRTIFQNGNVFFYLLFKINKIHINLLFGYQIA